MPVFPDPDITFNLLLHLIPVFLMITSHLAACVSWYNLPKWSGERSKPRLTNTAGTLEGNMLQWEHKERLADILHILMCIFRMPPIWGKLNPICTSLFWCIRYQGGGTFWPPLNIFGFGRIRVPILFGNYFPRSDLPYTKGFMKFGCPEPSKKVFDFWNFCSSKRRLTRFVRVPPYEILIFPTNFISFQGNELA